MIQLLLMGEETQEQFTHAEQGNYTLAVVEKTWACLFEFVTTRNYHSLNPDMSEETSSDIHALHLLQYVLFMTNYMYHDRTLPDPIRDFFTRLHLKLFNASNHFSSQDILDRSLEIEPGDIILADLFQLYEQACEYIIQRDQRMAKKLESIQGLILEFRQFRATQDIGRRRKLAELEKLINQYKQKSN